MLLQTTVQDRIIEVVRRVAGKTAASLTGIDMPPTGEPNRLRDALAAVLPVRVIWISTARISPAGVHRLTRPELLLAALYHPEYFPLPRFPLAISDLARAARSTMIGRVRLLDMQLVTILDALADMTNRPLVIAGGSLTARNERLLLERYPWLLIARGAGEPTIADILAHWHGDLDRNQVRGIGYTSAACGDGALFTGRRRKTATVPNRAQTDIFPELDLLGPTFEHRGVAQLESSRGCTNYCSFCPRGHKGHWSGAHPEALPWIVTAMREVFDRYPEVSRTCTWSMRSSLAAVLTRCLALSRWPMCCTGLGVPTRYTYITFDYLMSAEELCSTCAFQSCTDLLLRPVPHLSIEDIVDGVRNESFVAAHATGKPFYTGISYMLVSMECLIGAAYTKQVHAAGLTGTPRPSMGRLDAEFTDGRLSYHAQLWVDRHFVLDYALKSLEKVLDGRPRHAVRPPAWSSKTPRCWLMSTSAGPLTAPGS